MSWYKDQNISNEIIECKIKIAELEAKVYAYEKIIANSNFAPIIKKIVMKNKIKILEGILNLLKRY